MEKKVEKLIVDWLKSDNENATLLAHQICFLFGVSKQRELLIAFAEYCEKIDGNGDSYTYESALNDFESNL